MKCLICNTDIKGHYLKDEWQQFICVHHQVEQCSSCGRFVKPSDLHVADGRCLCNFCRPSVVILDEHIKWVEKRVRFIFSSHGIIDIPLDVPIHLVTPADMAKLKGANFIDLFQPGLTITSKTIGLFCSKYNHTIYIFNYLPKIQFAGVLAHEMLHVWQNGNNYFLSPKYTEGFCNLGSYLIYKTIDTDLSKYFIERLKTNPDPIYGDGFREVFEMYRSVKDLKIVMNRLLK